MQNYTRDVEITLFKNKNFANVWIFPYLVKNNNVTLVTYEKQPNSYRKVLSYNHSYYSEFYEKKEKKEYYIINCVDEDITNVTLVSNFSATGVFIKNIDVHKNLKISPEFIKKKNKHLKKLAKAKLYAYYDSLMKKRSKVYAQREIAKGYEQEVINFMNCLKYSKYKLLPEIVYIIMKFINFS